MMKSCVLRMVVMVVLGTCAGTVFAAFEPLQNYDQQFEYSLCCDETQTVGYATVHSWVEFDDEAGRYRYLYQIQDVSADYRIHYFQIPVNDEPISYQTSTSYGGYSGIINAFWSTLEQDGSYYGMGAFFTSAVTAGADSCILRFDTYEGPGQLSGLLSGFGPNGSVSLCGDVFVPAPEPTTLLLLASGAALMIRKKRS